MTQSQSIKAMKKNGKGTYGISDLKIKLNDTEITAELAKDKKSFKIEWAMR
ncbi:hypothetical protein [Latilactobacillus curvatus]|uniref:hypothetical protein n=1 Tax=Latilactobacillus curvatus TaxID=28038 RepID=UPI000A56D826|nr:hypothetical protein [Latilactobacillus curvatus]